MEDSDYIDLEPEAPAQFRYFDRWYRLELVIFMVCAPVFFGLLVINVWYYLVHASILGPLLRYTIMAAIVYFIMRLVYRQFLAGATSKTIVIDGRRVSKRNAGAISALDLSEVRGIRCPAGPLGRWLVLEADEPAGAFVLPVYVRNGHKMVDRVFRVLEDAGLRFEGTALMRSKLYNAAQRYSVLQKLRARQMYGMLSAASAVALLNMAAIMLFWECGPIAPLVALFWGVAVLFLQAAAYYIVERVHLRKLLKGGENTAASFTGYYVLVSIFALLAGMAAGVFVTVEDIVRIWEILDMIITRWMILPFVPM